MPSKLNLGFEEFGSIKFSRSYVEGVPTLYLSSATCKCRGCTAEIDGPQRKSIIEGEDEYNACIAALKTWNTRHADKEA